MPTHSNPATSSAAHFVPSMAAETTGVLQQVQVDLMQVANYYNDMQKQQGKMMRDVANDLATFNTNIGKEEGSALKSQGLGSVIGGGVGLALTGATYKAPSDLEEADCQVRGVQSYKDMIENPGNTQVGAGDDQPAGAASGAETSDNENVMRDLEQKQDFVNREEVGEYTFRGSKRSLYSRRFAQEGKSDVEQMRKVAALKPEDREKLIKSYERKLKAAEDQLSRVSSNHNSSVQRLTTLGQSIPAIFNGIGQTGAAGAEKDKGIEQAKASSAQSGLQGLQSLAGQSRSNAESYLAKAFDVCQEIAAISNANKMTS